MTEKFEKGANHDIESFDSTIIAKYMKEIFPVHYLFRLITVLVRTE